ncbi:hypothetical protein [Streptomyces sp. NPDC017529]|uniref:hypothetical protein n=1 Tax=Streptomyces sp. NPDC017529 TaxID=3365000 RepID=UPI00378A0311
MDDHASWDAVLCTGSAGGECATAARRLSVRPRFWDAAADAWLADDAEGLDRAWDDLIPELGADYDAYSNVFSLGWAASRSTCRSQASPHGLEPFQGPEIPPSYVCRGDDLSPRYSSNI